MPPKKQRKKCLTQSGKQVPCPTVGSVQTQEEQDMNAVDELLKRRAVVRKKTKESGF